MSNQSGAAATATVVEKPRSPPIKTRTERQETLVRMLRESLSRKISEKLGATREKEKAGKEREEGKEEGGEGGGGSESPLSTVSSSGEREGGYTIHIDSSEESGDESGELHVTVT